MVQNIVDIKPNPPGVIAIADEKMGIFSPLLQKQ